MRTPENYSRTKLMGTWYHMASATPLRLPGTKRQRRTVSWAWRSRAVETAGLLDFHLLRQAVRADEHAQHHLALFAHALADGRVAGCRVLQVGGIAGGQFDARGAGGAGGAGGAATCTGASMGGAGGCGVVTPIGALGAGVGSGTATGMGPGRVSGILGAGCTGGGAGAGAGDLGRGRGDELAEQFHRHDHFRSAAQQPVCRAHRPPTCSSTTPMAITAVRLSPPGCSNRS